VVFPLAAILVACLPIWFAVELARRGAQAGGPQRQWGVFNFALYFSTPLVFVLEIIGFILLVVGVAVWASTDPQRLAMIQRFQQDLLQAGGDIQSIQSLYLPLLRQPWILFGIYAGLALLIPLLEEFIKPLALWFLIGRDLDPASGLALGAIAGAGFALPETLLNLAGSAANPEWLGLAIGRFGTSLLHVATTALTGMAIASAWRSRRFHWLFLAFTLSCGLHGLWNGLTITSGLAPLLIPEPLSRGVVIASMGGLVLLAVGFVSLLIILNRRLRPVSHPDVQPGVENT
jgi:RsiW-degrading membrane proteinase PrsW (M82 family)